MIIGSSDPDSFRLYAAISRVDFDPRTLKFTLYYSSGGQAVLSIATNINTTLVTVSNITYATNTLRPFATFRSMWVSDGNSDVDHIRSDTNTRVWHIMQDGWTRLAGKNILFFRRCVSRHNTLSPDIRVEIQCTGSVADSTTTDSSTLGSTAHIATETMSATKFITTTTITTSGGSSTFKGRPVSATESNSQDKAASAADDTDTKTSQLLVAFIIFLTLCCCC